MYYSAYYRVFSLDVWNYRFQSPCSANALWNFCSKEVEEDADFSWGEGDGPEVLDNMLREFSQTVRKWVGARPVTFRLYLNTHVIFVWWGPTEEDIVRRYKNVK